MFWLRTVVKTCLLRQLSEFFLRRILNLCNFSWFLFVLLWLFLIFIRILNLLLSLDLFRLVVYIVHLLRSLTLVLVDILFLYLPPLILVLSNYFNFFMWCLKIFHEIIHDIDFIHLWLLSVSLLFVLLTTCSALSIIFGSSRKVIFYGFGVFGEYYGFIFILIFFGNFLLLCLFKSDMRIGLLDCAFSPSRCRFGFLLNSETLGWLSFIFNFVIIFQMNAKSFSLWFLLILDLIMRRFSFEFLFFFNLRVFCFWIYRWCSCTFCFLIRIITYIFRKVFTVLLVAINTLFRVVKRCLTLIFVKTLIHLLLITAILICLALILTAFFVVLFKEWSFSLIVWRLRQSS